MSIQKYYKYSKCSCSSLRPFNIIFDNENKQIKKQLLHPKQNSFRNVFYSHRREKNFPIMCYTCHVHIYPLEGGISTVLLLQKD